MVGLKVPGYRNRWDFVWGFGTRIWGLGFWGSGVICGDLWQGMTRECGHVTVKSSEMIWFLCKRIQDGDLLLVIRFGLFWGGSWVMWGKGLGILG